MGFVVSDIVKVFMNKIAQWTVLLNINYVCLVMYEKTNSKTFHGLW